MRTMYVSLSMVHAATLVLPFTDSVIKIAISLCRSNIWSSYFEYSIATWNPFVALRAILVIVPL